MRKQSSRSVCTILAGVAAGCLVMPQVARAQAPMPIAVVINHGAAESDATLDAAAALLNYYVAAALARTGRYSPVERPSTETLLSQRSLADAAALLSQAEKSYLALRMEAVLSQSKQAVQKYEKGAAYLADPTPFARTLVLLGATLLLQGDDQGAGPYFTQAAALVPDYEPDPAILSPVVRPAWRQRVQQLSERKIATLSIFSKPGAATLYVDGRFRGLAPGAVYLRPGVTHYVRLERPGYKTFTAEVTAEEGKDAFLEPRLEPLPRREETEALAKAFAELADPLAAAQAAPDQSMGIEADALRRLPRILGASAAVLAQVSNVDGRPWVALSLIDLTSGMRRRSVARVLPFDASLPAFESAAAELVTALVGIGPALATSSAALANNGAGAGAGMTVGVAAAGASDPGGSASATTIEASPVSGAEEDGSATKLGAVRPLTTAASVEPTWEATLAFGATTMGGGGGLMASAHGRWWGLGEVGIGLSGVTTVTEVSLAGAQGDYLSRTRITPGATPAVWIAYGGVDLAYALVRGARTTLALQATLGAGGVRHTETTSDLSGADMFYVIAPGADLSVEVYTLPNNLGRVGVGLNAGYRWVLDAELGYLNVDRGSAGLLSGVVADLGVQWRY